MSRKLKYVVSFVCLTTSMCLWSGDPPPDLSLTPGELASCYSNDFVGKTVVTRGVVTTVGFGPPTMHPRGFALFTDSQTRIFCTYSADVREDYRPDSGYEATVWGRVAGKRGDTVYLENCTVHQ